MCELCDVVFSEQTIGILSGLATTVIAAIVARIGYHQLEINKITVREKLFDRRFDVFRETQKFLTEISEKISFEKTSFWSFTDTCQRSRFLFGQEIHGYLLEIRKRALELELKTSLIDDPTEAERRSEHVQRRLELSVWLNNQLTVIFDRFHPYLGFSRV
jgi:hypothetical protein